MNYQVGQKVTIQGEDWYNTNKQPNGFIVFRDGNKISTFSPGMVKFCGKAFTVAKVVTGSSIYPDHYTFVEDGGAYKWSDQMIAGAAEGSVETYVRPEQPAAPTPQPTPQPKPVEQNKPVGQQKPVEQPKSKTEPKPVEQPKSKTEPKPVEQNKPVGQQKPVEQPKSKTEPKPTQQPKTVDMKKEEISDVQQPTAPTPQPKPVEQNKPVEQPKPAEPVSSDTKKPDPAQSTEIDAFESFKLLLKPRENAPLTDCAVQAYKIISANDMFPEVSFDFNGFEFSITRK